MCVCYMEMGRELRNSERRRECECVYVSEMEREREREKDNEEGDDCYCEKLFFIKIINIVCFH